MGADFRLKCEGCGHQVMVSRKLVEKNTKEIRKKGLKEIEHYDKIAIVTCRLNKRLKTFPCSRAKSRARDQKGGKNT